MPIPQVTGTIKDGALGVLPESVGGLSVKIGVSSLGTPNTIFSFGPGAKEELKNTLGQGPLVEAAAYHLDVSGQPVLCVPVTTTNGSNSAVTKTGTGTGTMTVAGNPRDGYEAIIEILRDGTNLAAATATFRYSLDGGDSFSPELALPTGGTFVLPDTGLTLTFVNGGSGTSFVKGDLHKFTSAAPTYDLTALNAALDALLADSREWGFVHIVGASSATIAAGVASKMTAAENALRYTFALLEARDANSGETEDQWMTALQADFASFASARVMVAAGHVELSSAITGRVHRRSCGAVLAARIAKAPISEDLGRVASGAVPGVSKLHHDEAAKPGLDAARFATVRTHLGRQGFYITAGKMMAAAGSDFGLVQRRRVMDRACAVVRAGLLLYLNDSVLVDASGQIDESQARAWEGDISGQLDGDLTANGHVSGASVALRRDGNILSTETVEATVALRPVGYARQIKFSIGFTNPALAAAAA